jgi:Skp family chaperone for outer membrane proteins
MKKILALSAVFLVSLTFLGSTNAQQVKIGVYDEETVLGLFPDIQKFQTALDQYAQDSLRGEYDYTLSEFKRKDSIFKKDSASMTGSVRAIMQKEILGDYNKLANWQQYQQQMMQAKQGQLLQPYLQKMDIALREIITEQKYTLILRKDALYGPGPLADNLSIKVAQKLKLPLPADMTNELKRQGIISGLSEPVFTKPTSKPASKQ